LILLIKSRASFINILLKILLYPYQYPYWGKWVVIHSTSTMNLPCFFSGFLFLKILKTLLESHPSNSIFKPNYYLASYYA